MRRSPFILSVMLLAASIAQATTFTFNQAITIQPGQIFFNGSYEEFDEPFTSPPTFDVEAGDVITGTISFADGPVTIESAANEFADDAYLIVGPTNDGVSVSESFSVAWQGLTIAPGTAGPITSGSGGGCCAVAGDLSTAPAHDFSFIGFTYTITFSSVSLDSSQVSAAFTPGSLYLGGGSLTYGQASAAPEPGTLGLFITASAFLAVKRRTLSRRFGSLARSACGRKQAMS